MTHYICKGGCKGVSDYPKTCGGSDCPFYGKSMEQCDCEDGTHKGAFERETFGQSERGEAGTL